MTFTTVPVAPFEQLAVEIPGFTSDEQQLSETLKTTIFVSGASAMQIATAGYPVIARVLKDY